MAAPSTKAKLLSLIEDVEIVSKELLDFLSTARPSRQDDVDTGQLIALLKMKDEELQETAKIAKEQGETQKMFDALRQDVDKRDDDIKQLQRSLKDAENILATAIYQAKQKLQAINQANSRKISSEELIKYAHKISASNAVSAPPTWAPGDPRRPYPTELDMRYSLLCRPPDMQMMQSQLGFDGSRGAAHQPIGQHGVGTSSLTWQPSVEVQSTMITGLPSQYATTMDSSKSHAKDNDEVELMSSDSSSSSSSDE